MNFKEKVKETYETAKEKTIHFVSNHPVLCTVIAVAGGCLVTAAIKPKPMELEAHEPIDYQTYVDAYKKIEDDTPKWKEEYRENYDKVKDLTASLKLYPGEMFIIEDQTQFMDDPFFTKLDATRPVVSHMIDGYGVYPPEDDD